RRTREAPARVTAMDPAASGGRRHRSKRTRMATTESHSHGERYVQAHPNSNITRSAPPIARCLPVIGSLPPAGNPGRTGGFLPGRLSPNAHGEGGRRPNVLGVHQGKRETGVPMRRSSIVVLLAVVVCAPAGWTGAAVLAQPDAHHRSSAAAPPSGEPN